MKKKPLDFELYGKGPILDLILFSIYSVEKIKQKPSFERILKECYSLFPKVFAFEKYPEWPDARKLDRPLRSLRNKKLISGDSKTIFKLTKAGKNKAEVFAKNLRQGKLKI